MATKKTVSTAVKAAAKPSMSKAGVGAEKKTPVAIPKATKAVKEKKAVSKEKRTTTIDFDHPKTGCAMACGMLCANQSTTDEIFNAVIAKFPAFKRGCISTMRGELNNKQYPAMREHYNTVLPISRLIRDASGKLIPYVKGEGGSKPRAKKGGEAKAALVAAGVLPPASATASREGAIEAGLITPAASAKPAAATKKTPAATATKKSSSK